MVTAGFAFAVALGRGLTRSPMTAKPHSPAIPAVLADVALIDGPTCAASAGVSLRQWQDFVRDGQAPKPAIQRPRMTRWRVSDVRQWLASLSTAEA